MEVWPVLVELKIPENVGFIARLVKNYGINRLCLYRCKVNEASYYTAANAKDVLENAVKIEDLREFLEKMNLVVGTTGIAGGDYRFLRKDLLKPEELPKIVKGGKVAVLFGREDFGLYREELEICHAIVRIPTNEEYPVMNVSHAAAVVLYFLKNDASEERGLATTEEIEILISNLVEMLKLVNFPQHRLERTTVVFRRILGRAGVKSYEVQTLNGIFRKTISYIKRMNKERT